VNDLVRFAPTPAEGARRVLSFAENIGSEDNASVIVVPLLGWGKPQGSDVTKELRDYKLNQAGEPNLAILSTLLSDEHTL
jgi:protein phosphatase PTC6